MKQKISITVEEEVLKVIDKHLESGIFRNKSHMFELAVKRLLEEEGSQ